MHSFYRLAVRGVVVALASGLAGGHSERLFAEAAQDPAAVYVRADFDAEAPPFAAEGHAAVSVVGGAPNAPAGRALSISRSTAGGYFGAALSNLRVEGSSGLRVAFMVRAAGMRTVTVNLYDEARQDNSTPASPARVIDGEWRAVVFHVEDFHYNSDPPDRKVGGGERFVSLLVHGSQQSESPQVWIDKLAIYRGPDRQPPGAPDALAAQPDGAAVTLTWREPPDDTYAVVYNIHRQTGGGAWVKVGESLTASYRDTVPAPGTYRYRITAADYENNVSVPSPEVTATASAGNAAPTSIDIVADRERYAEHVREIHARGRGTLRSGVFLFAGDSITGADAYTHTLGSWLARGQTVRQGVAGVTTRYGRDNIEDYLRNAQPEFAVIMYGTNDGKGGGDVEDAMRNLSAIVDACIARGTVPVLATIPPRGYSKGQGGERRFNAALVELARARRVPVSYVFETMMARDLRQMLYDGIHLTPEHGNDAAGEALRRTMDQVYFALR